MLLLLLLEKENAFFSIPGQSFSVAQNSSTCPGGTLILQCSAQSRVTMWSFETGRQCTCSAHSDNETCGPGDAFQARRINDSNGRYICKLTAVLTHDLNGEQVECFD